MLGPGTPSSPHSSHEFVPRSGGVRGFANSARKTASPTYRPVCWCRLALAPSLWFPTSANELFTMSLRICYVGFWCNGSLPEDSAKGLLTLRYGEGMCRHE